MKFRNKVVVTSPSFYKNDILRFELEDSFENITYNKSGRNIPESEVHHFLSGAEAVILGLERISKETINKCPELRMISKYGVGINNIDFDLTESKNVKVFWTPGVNKRSVAELVLGYMLGVSRNIFNSTSLMRSGYWDKNGGHQISGKTIGIIGCGNIGMDLISILKPFNMKILINDIISLDVKDIAQNIKLAGLEEIFIESDFISIHVPFNKDTENLIGSNFLSLMKEDALLINTSRGGIINEKVLLEVLEKKSIYVALDVFEVEPQIGTKLLTNTRVFGTPHIGGASSEAILAMGRAAIHHLIKFYSELNDK